MSIDKELYRDAYAQYQRWNEVEAADRSHHARKLTPTQAWRQYVELVEFCWRLNPQQSHKQRIQKLAALEQYYTNVRQLEARRSADVKQT